MKKKNEFSRAVHTRGPREASPRGDGPCRGIPRVSTILQKCRRVRASSPRAASRAWAAPRATAHSRVRCIAWAARVDRTGEFVFLFHKELEIVF